jgi:hypothetical protein
MSFAVRSAIESSPEVTMGSMLPWEACVAREESVAMGRHVERSAYVDV